MRRCWRWMDALPAQPGPGAGSRGLVPDHGRHLGYRRRVPSVLGILADCAYSSARRHSLIGLRGSCRSPWCGGGASNEEVNMAHFSVLPPEINSLRMYLGAGSAPMLQAAAAWDGLAAELGTAASSFSSVTWPAPEWPLRPTLPSPGRAMEVRPWPHPGITHRHPADSESHDATRRRPVVRFTLGANEGLQPLDNGDVGGAAALAHGLQPVAATDALQLAQHGGEQFGAGGA